VLIATYNEQPMVIKLIKAMFAGMIQRLSQGFFVHYCLPCYTDEHFPIFFRSAIRWFQIPGRSAWLDKSYSALLAVFL
jgi:hypothetical protein